MINVTGLGYIGLPTALILATSGNKVVGTDIKEEVIDKLKYKKLTLEEKGMDELFEKALNADTTSSLKPVSTSFYIITAPAPYDPVSKKLDCSYVVKVVGSVLEPAEEDAIIVAELTISPGAIDAYVRPVVNAYMERSGKKLNLVHAPERIIPGNIVYELEHNTGTIGADDPKYGEKVKQVYSLFCKGEIDLANIKTAEMAKVVENTFRDINIAFANELVKICRQDGLDANGVIRISNKHPRVNILSPGPGIGGHCIPIDPWFLVEDYPLLTEIVYKAHQVNDSMPEYVLRRVYNIMQGNNLKDFSRVGIYGLTYKENIDDMRESPTLQLLQHRKEHLGNGSKVYDLMVKREIVENQYHDSNKFLNDVDFVIVMISHDEIRQNVDVLKDKVVLDTRSIDAENKYNFYKL